MKTDLIAIVLGLLLRYWVGRRRFNRRNVAGLQQFTSYERGVLTYGMECLLKLFGLLLIVTGIANEALKHMIHH